MRHLIEDLMYPTKEFSLFFWYSKSIIFYCKDIYWSLFSKKEELDNEKLFLWLLTASRQLTKVEKSSWASCCSKFIRFENDWRIPNKDMISRLSLSFPSLISKDRKTSYFLRLFSTHKVVVSLNSFCEDQCLTIISQCFW